MNRLFAAVAFAVTGIALVIPMRRQTFARPEIDGHPLRLLVTGAGGPTVVFENGLGGPLENWGKVQPAVSRFTRTVSYDRAGVGLSGGTVAPRDGRRAATELRQALAAAGVAPPYVLVGHSIGGQHVRTFASLYPDAVSALLLVDPTPGPDGDRRVRPGTPVVLIDAISPPEVPFATGAIRLLQAANRRENEADAVQYRQWLDTIPGSRLVVTRRSGHNVPQEEPALVIATIRDLVAGVRRASASR